jgi:hypothetical protein
MWMMKKMTLLAARSRNQPTSAHRRTATWKLAKPTKTLSNGPSTVEERQPQRAGSGMIITAE